MSTGYREVCFNNYSKECAVCANDECVEVHHIDGDASNHNNQNLIPLCVGCHDIVENHSWTKKVNAEIDATDPTIRWLVKKKRANSPNTEPSERHDYSRLEKVKLSVEDLDYYLGSDSGTYSYDINVDVNASASAAGKEVTSSASDSAKVEFYWEGSTLNVSVDTSTGSLQLTE